MENYYPVFLNIAERRVVVVGGGRVAFRKVQALLDARAQCLVVSPGLSPALQEMAERGDIQWVRDSFKEQYLQGAWLVIAATDDSGVQEHVYRACEEKRIFCNVVDVPGWCSFIVPSIVRRGALKIAISTSGLGPGLAKNIRKELEARFPEEYERYVECVGKLRRFIIRRYEDADEKARRLEILFDLNTVKWFIDGDVEAIEHWALELGGTEALSIVRECHG